MPAPTADFAAHGLLVRSDLPLRLPGAVTPGRPDIVLRRGPDRPVPAGAPAGELLAAVHNEHRRTFYGFARDAEHTILRYPGLCEFVGDRELRDVVVHLEPGADAGVLPVVAAGAVLAVHLMLRGELVLHASAVRVGDGAVAFVGASGMGKSTLATLLCADGHELLADDVVRVDLAGCRGPTVFPGSVESRLRPGASMLVDAFPAAVVHRTADGRSALTLGAYRGASLPLLACVVPFPDHETGEITVTALSRSRGLRRLLQFPRIVGWVEQTWQVRNFEALADLASLVPVYEARVPWGPPFPGDLARRLTAALGARSSDSGPGSVTSLSTATTWHTTPSVDGVAVTPGWREVTT